MSSLQTVLIYEHHNVVERIVAVGSSHLDSWQFSLTRKEEVSNLFFTYMFVCKHTLYQKHEIQKEADSKTDREIGSWLCIHFFP